MENASFGIFSRGCGSPNPPGKMNITALQMSWARCRSRWPVVDVSGPMLGAWQTVLTKIIRLWRCVFSLWLQSYVICSSDVNVLFIIFTWYIIAWQHLRATTTQNTGFWCAWQGELMLSTVRILKPDCILLFNPSADVWTRALRAHSSTNR